MHLWRVISCWLIPKQEQTAKQEVLHYGKLRQDLHLVHLNHARVDLHDGHTA